MLQVPGCVGIRVFNGLNDKDQQAFVFVYGRDIFDQLLAVPGCEGIRVFNAYTDELTQAFVFVTIDGRNNNIREYKKDNGEIVKAPIADTGLPCPADCPNLDSDMAVPGWEDYIIKG